MTHDEIRRFVTGTGLEIVDEHRDEPTSDDRRLLQQHHASLDLAGLDERWLFECWILILARRPGG